MGQEKVKPPLCFLRSLSDGRGHDSPRPVRAQLAVRDSQSRWGLCKSGAGSPHGSATRQTKLRDLEGRFWLLDVMKSVSSLLFACVIL